MIVTAGSINKSAYFYVVGDASNASPGEPVTGLLFSDIETGGSASYARQGAARVDLTLITLASPSAVHADGGFIEVDGTNMKGLYRCDYPDAVWATGIDQAFLQIVVAAANNAVAAPILVDITDVDLRDSVRGGMTALPNAAADAAGGLPISDAGGLPMDDIPLTAEFEARTIVSANYALASVVTEARLAELDPANLPADIDNITSVVEDNQLEIANMQGTTFSSATDSLEAIRNQGDTAWITAVSVAVTSIGANVITAASIAASAMDGKGDWNIGKTGYSLTQSFPTNFADLAITVTTGLISVGTNNDKTGYSVSAIGANVITAASIAASAMDGKGDWNIGKTGYSLTQSFPTNFADLAITLTTGQITVGTNNDKTGYSVSTIGANVINAASIAASALDGKGDWNIGKTGYSLTQTFPSNFADLAITITTGKVTVGTNDDKTGYSISVIGANVITASSIAASALDGKGDWNIVVPDVAGTVAAIIGVAGASLTDLGGMSTAMKAEVLAEVVKVLTTQMTEAYAADGVAPTLTQALFLTMQNLQSFSFSGTVQTVNKIDDTTAAATYLLDDATNPTSKTRTT